MPRASRISSDGSHDRIGASFAFSKPMEGAYGRASSIFGAFSGWKFRTISSVKRYGRPSAPGPSIRDLFAGGRQLPGGA